MLNRCIEDYEHIYIACGYTDMRKGIDGLAYIAQKKLGKDPFSNSLFLFCGRRRCFFKALSWAGNGFELYYRRFDGKGATLKWPMCAEEAVGISVEQLRTLLDGFSILPAKGFEEVTSRNLWSRSQCNILFLGFHCLCKRLEPVSVSGIFVSQLQTNRTF